MEKELTPETSDAELWAHFQSGDKTAFKAIYYKYYMLLYRYGCKTTPNEELVEDSLQDLFLKLWKNRSSLGQVASIKSYLYRAYMRTLFDALKKNSRTYNGADLMLEESESSVEESLISGESVTETNKHLHSALEHLSKRQKQVVILYYFEGLSYKQIAEILPIKYQGIRNVVHEAVKVLRKNISRTFFTSLLTCLVEVASLHF
jgi:RNA polymerase sigma-70 factor (ECF subfamily)